MQPTPYGYGPPAAPPSWAGHAEDRAERRERRWFLGCVGLGCLVFVAVVALVGFLAFLDHFGFINDSFIKTIRRCRTFGC